MFVRQRRAHSVQTCLSPEPRPATLLFDPHGSVRNETHRFLTMIIYCDFNGVGVYCRLY